MQITHHTQLLNALIEKYGLKSYLEIGVQNPANNFDKINLPIEKKWGVDPEVDTKNIYNYTSDYYFKMLESTKITYDLIFIDGLHHADQVKRDFENSLRCLSDNGYILIHDTLPTNENTTHVPRNSKVWHGDVYKFAMTLHHCPGIGFITFNIDSGCTLVWKMPEKKGVPVFYSIDWEVYKRIGRVLLNVQDEVKI